MSTLAVLRPNCAKLQVMDGAAITDMEFQMSFSLARSLERRLCGVASILVAGLTLSALAETAHAEGDPEVGAVLAQTEGDFDGDGVVDQARLVVAESRYEGESADLIVTFGGARAPQTFPNVAWRGLMAGMQPEIEATSRGSLRVKAQNYGIGRFRWEETLTIAWRDDAFYVAGYTYFGSDSGDLTIIRCDVNLFTGSAVRNDETISVAPRRIALADWTEASAPEECSSAKYMVPSDH